MPEQNKNQEQEQGQEQQHHYFGATFFNWTTASTREEVVKKLAKEAGAEGVKLLAKNYGGLPCVTYKVKLPKGAHYTIEEFRPHTIINEGRKTDEPVPLTAKEKCLILNTKGKVALEF